jgi:hypothetical protein
MPHLFLLPLLLLPLAHTASKTPKGLSELKMMTACSAVSASEIEALLGSRIGKGKEDKDSSGSTCEYVSGGGHITIALRHSPSKIDVDAEIVTIHASLPHANLRDVSGVGTRAFFLDMDTAGTQLNVLRGDYDYLLVSVLGFGDAAHVSEATEKIARLAVGRF